MNYGVSCMCVRTSNSSMCVIRNSFKLSKTPTIKIIRALKPDWCIVTTFSTLISTIIHDPTPPSPITLFPITNPYTRPPSTLKLKDWQLLDASALSITEDANGFNLIEENAGWLKCSPNELCAVWCFAWLVNSLL